MFNSKKGRALPSFMPIPVLQRAVGTQPVGFCVAIGFKCCVFKMYTINEFTIFRRPSTCAVMCRPFRAWMLRIFLKALKGLNASAQAEGLRADDFFLNLPFKWI
jgi:hypothetical protein